MASVAPAARMLPGVTEEAVEELRQVLLHSYSNFEVYRRVMSGRGIFPREILACDPVGLLQRLPLLEGDTFTELTEESVLVGTQIVDIETSSGTTGPRKRRFISYEDDASETAFLARLFSFCGIGRSDRVACLDTDPLTLMVSVTKALDLLGVQEAYSYCVGADFSTALEALPKLDPTVIVGISSIIERCSEPLREHSGPSLSKIVYAGEPLSDNSRTSLESALGVELFGYYGASETSALGIECGMHDGVHLFTDRNIIEILLDDPGGSEGDIVVTTLEQETLPLIRYALKDMISVKPGDCRCGASSPRVEILGRRTEGVSILGAKVHPEPIVRAVYGESDARGHLLQLRLTRDEREKLTLVLPERLASEEPAIRVSLLRSQPDLDFLVRGGFLSLELSFVDESYFEISRKLGRVVDLRAGQG